MQRQRQQHASVVDMPICVVGVDPKQLSLVRRQFYQMHWVNHQSLVSQHEPRAKDDA